MIKFLDFKNNSRSFLTRLSQAFMLPIAILPFAGLMLGIGGAIGANVKEGGAILVGDFLRGASGVIFDNIPLFFGASVAIAFSKKNRIYAGFTFLLAYLVFLSIQSVFIFYENGTFKSILGLHNKMSDQYIVSLQLGIRALNTSIFGGIIVGSVVAWIMNRWSEFELPTYLSFFSGIRLVPIILIPFSAILAFTFLLIWPWVGRLIETIGYWSAQAPGGVDGLVYGMLGRALMPLGLHHILISIAWQTNLGGELTQVKFVGAAETLGVLNHPDIQGVLKSFENVDGTFKIFSGDQRIWNFLNSLPYNTLPTNNNGGSLPLFQWVARYTSVHAGRFMQDYPIYLGAIQGIGLALIFSAKKENRKKIAAIIGSSMAVAFLTGITEPLEFSFLFVAPLFYYWIYVPLSGLAYMFMKLAGAHVGVGFARGFIDYIIFGALPIQKGTQFYWAIPFALGMGIFTFFTFSWMIKRFNWKTPGRSDEEAKLINKKEYLANKNQTRNQNEATEEISDILVRGYGGITNIISVTACATRLRVTVKDESKVNKDLIMAQGARGFISKGTSSQAIFGGKAQILSSQITEKYGDKIGEK